MQLQPGDRLFTLFALWETAAEAASTPQESAAYERCMEDLRGALGMTTTPNAS
ncbi:hypothetical protein ACFY1L_55050 [Streptomyces sp. NPDC001663]|uniref:hypothetical protein n=1 Tax=Streptomyces sp. NPDC001663 TaxID=3364597 RepID=UPI0036A4DE85